jgi:hypothetical protein
MSLGRSFLDIFDRVIDRLLCVAGAVLFSQAPEFMQQYLQRLGGHLAEARRQLALFQQTAAESGLSLERFINQTAANADPAVAKLGDVMTAAVDRTASLQIAHDTLFHAASWDRPFVFLRHFDASIARATAAAYQPAIPTTAEGLVYALTGMLCLLAVYHLVLKRLAGLFTRSGSPAQSEA